MAYCGMGKEGAVNGAACCYGFIFVILGFANFIIQIVAVVASSDADGFAMLAEGVNGKMYYKALPIVSIVIPNPITTGITAFTDCNKFDNCDESYRDLYVAAFWLNMVGVFMLFGFCCVACCCMGPLAR